MVFHINDIDASTWDAIKAAYDNGERVFDLSIDSYGGSLESAFRIYDLLRGDAENVVSCSVRGNCISAATVLLCAAPVERRTATKNSAFLIHSPLITLFGYDVNKAGAEQLKNEIDAAYDQLKNIYLERTTIDSVIADTYMKEERTFYAGDALNFGFIGHIEEMYNKKEYTNTNTNKMGKIKDLVMNILSQLKNELFKTQDGTEFEAMSIEVGVPVDLVDGVYTLEDQTVITVEGGIIVDVIPAEEKKEDAPVDNEGDKPEGDEPEKKEGEGDEPEKKEVEEATEDLEKKIAEAVETAVAELKEEIINKYKPMVELIQDLGGLKKLEALKNAQPEGKYFASENKKQTNLEQLMDKIKNRKG